MSNGMQGIVQATNLAGSVDEGFDPEDNDISI